MINVDPIAARERYAERQGLKDYVTVRLLAPALYHVDPPAALSLEEGLKAFEDRAQVLLTILDSLPDGPDPRKPILLDRLSALADAGDEAGIKLMTLGEIGERLAESGRIDLASALFAREMPRAVALPNGVVNRGRFAVSLGCLDPETALGMIRAIPDRTTRVLALLYLARRVASSRPSAYDRVAEAIEADSGPDSDPRLLAIPRMAVTDPDRRGSLPNRPPTPHPPSRTAWPWPSAWPADRRRRPSGPITRPSPGPTRWERHEASASPSANSTSWRRSTRSWCRIPLVRRLAPEPPRPIGAPAGASREAQLAASGSRYDRADAEVLIARDGASPGGQPRGTDGTDPAPEPYAREIDPPACLRLIESLPKRSDPPGNLSPRDRAGLRRGELLRPVGPRRATPAHSGVHHLLRSDPHRSSLP